MIKTSKKNGIININPTLEIGGIDMDLSIQMAIDGEVVIDKKSDSLLAGLLRILMNQMGGIPDAVIVPALYCATNGFPSYNEMFSDQGEVITDAATYSGTKTKITTSATQGFIAGDWVMISSLTGDWTACNGLHQIVDDISSTEFSIDVNSSAFGALGVAFSPQVILLRTPTEQMPYSGQFNYNEIWLGKGNTAVTIDDRVPNDFIGRGSGPGQLDWTDDEIDPAVVGVNATTNICTMTFSRDFTNNSGATIAIEEASLFTLGNIWSTSTNHYHWTMIARDLISTTILDGGTATVNYRIRTSLDAEGGFLEQMLQAWAQQSVPGYNLIDTDGTAPYRGASDYKFRMVAPSGDNRTGTSIYYYDPSHLGPQVGTGNTAVNVEDRDLETKIIHGDGSTLTVSGTSGNLVININAVDYSEAFSVDADTTVTNWVATHGATLLALGTPVIATRESSAVIKVSSTGALVYIDNSTGDFAFVVASQLKIYGALIENLLVNDTPGEASFDIIRIFENNSGTSITINEVGLVCSPYASQYQFLFCLSRHVLAAPIVVADGEILRLTHTIKVVL